MKQAIEWKITLTFVQPIHYRVSWVERGVPHAVHFGFISLHDKLKALAIGRFC